ncbi:Hypothetical protein SRAE_2000468800 [Strongyloides ratti]|uniref:Uncharacterized protein n=1 Tax=Strongyloides ratti TaxID=34506 RepID=A0A090LJP9_STRRB|nr:Hypothetical protein SRAE_2000468800 [Strongyloides ratti]CEF70047.1 Hypothetical protein SRAE_2000468800 [Strongyloides ratti]
MKLSIKFINILSFFVIIQTIFGQSVFDDLIDGALRLVKPIIETAKPIVEDIGRSTQKDNAESPLRDENILGIHPLANKNYVPICKGNSRICEFISCSAHNFKYDSNFANLNLVAQLMGDKKMRKALSSNPQTVTEVCQEQGLSETECKLFARGFTLMDNFITNLEGNEDSINNSTMHDEINKNDNHIISHNPSFDVPIRPNKDKDEYDIDIDEKGNLNDDYTYYQSSLPRTGSRNWSSKQKNVPLPRPTTLPIKPISTTHLKIKSISFGESINDKITVPRAQLPKSKQGLIPIIPVNRPHISRRDATKKVPIKKNTPANNRGKKRLGKNEQIRFQPKKSNQIQLKNKNNNQKRVPKSIDEKILISNFINELNLKINRKIVKRSSDYYDDVSPSTKPENKSENKDINLYDDNGFDEHKKTLGNNENKNNILKKNCLQFLG